MIICLWCSIQHNKNNKIKNNLAEAKRRRGPKIGYITISTTVYMYYVLYSLTYLSVRKTSRTTPSRPIIPPTQYTYMLSPYHTTYYHQYHKIHDYYTTTTAPPP